MHTHRPHIAAVLAACALLAGACSSASPQQNALTYGLTLSPTGIDPHLNASSELGIPLSSVYDTLVFQDPHSSAFVPGLAERWTISPDGLTYTFYLRHDVTFHDSSAFNAEAVRANIEYTLNPDNHSQKAASMLGPLDRVEVIDEYTVALHLKQPFAPLLDSLSQVYLGMASPAALAKWGSAEYQFHQVGTGPYRFVEYVPNDHITLAANPDYAWAPSIYRQPHAQVETITFRFYVDLATRALALESGEVDIIGEVPYRDAARLTATNRFQLYPIPVPGQPLQFLFNTRRSPTDDLNVRGALIEAVDRPAIVGTVFGSYSPVAQGPLSAVTPGFTSQYPFPAYDPADARALLESAGWAADASGRRRRQGQPLELRLIVPNWGNNPDVGQLVKAAWEAIGASVTLEQEPDFGQLKEAQARGDYSAIGLNFFDNDPDLLRPFYSSDGLYNWTGVHDADIDATLLQASEASLDSTKRTALYAQLADRIRQLALILPVRDYVDLVVADRRVQGVEFSSQGWFPLLIDLRLVP
jgi:peptide/nickel transport system substrate-binding protein